MNAGQVIRWGIIGTGRMANLLARELRALCGHGAVLAAVASRDPTRAREFADRHDVARAYASVDELAAQTDIDAVYIASPPSAHAQHVRTCIAARKAVLCEKPFTINAREAGELIQRARDRGSFLMEAMWTRFLPSVISLRQSLQDREIGELQLIVAGGGFIPAPDPDYYLFNPTLGGGALLDAGVYLVSMSSMVLGTPLRTFASADIGVHGVDEHDVLVLDHVDGARALLYVSLRTSRMPDLEIMGSRGRIRLHGPVFKPPGYTITRGDAFPEHRVPPVDGSGYGYQVLEVMNCLRKGHLESEVMPLDETLTIMRTLDNARSQFGMRYAADVQPCR